MLHRIDLESAIAVLAEQGDRLGESVVATTLAVLHERLAATERVGGTMFLQEPPGEQRKQVTVLFTAVDGLTELSQRLPEAQRVAFINRLWRRLDDAVTFHGGVVDKHMGDVVMSLFGAPVANENDAERAVRCALAMIEALGQFAREFAVDVSSPIALASRLPIRIGINTGPVVLGQVGSDGHVTVIGDPVNVASRLKEAAPASGVYISHETYRLVEHLYQVEPLGLMPVKGRRTPVTVYRVAGSRPRQFFSSRQGVHGLTVPMVGREREMQALQAIVQEALQTGRGRFLTVIGEAGVGKSRLVGEFNRWLENSPARVRILQGRTEPRLQLAPYSLMRDLIVNAFEIRESDRPSVVEQKLTGGLKETLSAARGVDRPASVWRARARTVGGLLGLDLPPRRVEPEGGPTRERDGVHLIEFFGALAARSQLTVVFMEDIHWADNDSLDLLVRLSRLTGHAPLLIICLARPSLLERRPDWLEATRDAGADPDDPAPLNSQITLLPLGEAESRELVRQLLRRLDDIPRELTDLIVRSSGGNPYYVEELIKVLIEDGLIVAGEDRWLLRSGQLSRVRVPATLTGVLQARLDRLPDLERVTMQQAAVIGDEFWDTALQQLNRDSRQPFAPDQLRAALAGLEGRDLIYRTTSVFTDAAAYRFKHAVLHEVTYDSVLLRDRPIYHLAAARWLEAESGARAAEYAAAIAVHYERAGEIALATAAYQQAAGRAEEQYNLSVAIESYRKVLDLIGDMPQFVERRLRVQERLGRALQRQGRLVEAFQAFDGMRGTAELDGNLVQQARAENALAGIHGQWRERGPMLERAAAAVRLSRLTGSALDLAQALLLASEARSLGNRTDEAIGLAQEALTLAETEAGARETLRALAQIGRLQRLAGRRADALATAARLRAERQRLRSAGLAEAATALVLEGRLRLQLGEREQAEELAAAALIVGREADDRDGIVESLTLSGHVALAREDALAAQLAFAEAAAAAESVANEPLLLRADLGLVEAMLTLGDAAGAEARLRDLLRRAGEREHRGPWAGRAEVLSLLALAMLDQGRKVAARDQAVEAFAAAVESAAPVALASAFGAMGEALAAVEDERAPNVSGERLTALVCFERAERWLDRPECGPELALRRRRMLLAWAVEVARRGDDALAAALAGRVKRKN